MQQHTRPELADLTYANLPNNTAGAIDPAKLREVVLALVASQLNLLDDGNPGAGTGNTTPTQQAATFGNLGGAAQDNVSLVSYLASLGHSLTEFTPPMSTQGGRWYLTSTGIWEAKSSFNAASAPAAGAYWRLVVSFGDALTATAAGKALLAAPTATAQRVLLDIFSRAAGAYGAGQPEFTNLYKEDGAVVYLLKKVDALSTQLAVINLAPSTTSPTITGFLPASGAVGASITITGTLFTKASVVTFNGTPASFQVINATTIVAVVPTDATTGPVAVTNAAGTGTSAANFTVSASPVVVTPPATATLTAALAISVASIVAGNPLTFEVTAGGGTAPYAYAVKATNNATGAVTILGSSASGSFTPQTAGTSYNIDATVTDSAGKVAQATTRTVTTTSAQTVNQIPVVEAGDQLTITLPTSSVALMATASDPDAGDTLTYRWRQITGPAGASTATGMPATSLNVVVSGLVAGTYQFGFTATDQKGGKSTEDFVVVTVNPVAAQVATVFDFTTSSTGFGLSVYDEQKNGYRRRSPFADVDIYTNASTVDYALVSTNGSPLSIYVNGAFATAPTASGTLTIPGSGFRTVRFVDAPQSKPGDVGEVQGGWFTKLTFPAGTTNSIAAQAATSKRLLIIGDSILSEGYASDVPGRDGASFLLRAKRGYDVLVDGWGNRSLFYSLGTPELRAAQVQRAQAAGVTELILALGTNDEVLGYATAQQAADIAVQLLDGLHSALPNVKLYLFTRTLWLQSTSTAYADAMKTLAAGRSWLTIIDPLSWLDPSDIHPNDTAKLHPVNSGHIKLANYTSDVLDGLPTPGNGLAVGSSSSYTVTSKTTAAQQTASVSSVNSAYSLVSSSATIGISAGWERWQSNVFVSNEALVTKSDTALLTIKVSCASDFLQALYAPFLPDFGLAEISLNNGATWIAQNQQGSVRASDFRGYDTLSTGTQTILVRKKAGQDPNLYICWDHAEFQAYTTVTSRQAVAPQTGVGFSTSQPATIPFAAYSSSGDVELWASSVFASGSAWVTKDENAIFWVDIEAGTTFQVASYSPRLPNFCLLQYTQDGGQNWVDINQNGGVANANTAVSLPIVASPGRIGFRKKPGQNPSFYVCKPHCDVFPQ
jgi:hypothetical protein